MGGTISKSTVQSFTDIATNVTQETIQSCTSVSTQSQNSDVVINGDVSGGTFEQLQEASIDLDCAFSATKQNEIFSKVANAIAQQADSETEGALTSLGGTTAEVSATIFNSFKNNITQTDIQEVKSAINQSQKRKLVINGDVTDTRIGQTQLATSVARTVVESTNMSKIIQEVANKFDQEAKSKSTGVVASVARTLGLTLAAAALVVPLAIAAVVILIVFIIMIPFVIMASRRSKKDGGDEDSEDDSEDNSEDNNEGVIADTNDDTTDNNEGVITDGKKDHDCGCSEGVCRCEENCDCTGDCPCVKKDN